MTGDRSFFLKLTLDVLPLKVADYRGGLSVKLQTLDILPAAVADSWIYFLVGGWASGAHLPCVFSKENIATDRVNSIG